MNPGAGAIKMSGVRHDAAHSLVTVYGSLGYRERSMRPWECTCGTQFGSLYDNAARAVYRRHRARALRDLVERLSAARRERMGDR